jgi:hypothetical protein
VFAGASEERLRTLTGERGTRESNPNLRFWRPPSSPLDQSPSRRRWADCSDPPARASVRPLQEHTFVSRVWSPPDGRAYSYLLGLYLGDGCILIKPRGGAQLAIVCDAAYPDLIEDCWAALILVSLNPRVTRYSPPGQRCVRLISSWRCWPEVFPPARARPQAHPQDRARGLAARGRRPLPAGAAPGAAALGRLPHRQPLQDPAAERAGRRVRLSALVLLEPVGGHPRAVLRVLRAARGQLDAVQPAQHLGLPPPQRRAARLVRAAQVVTAAGAGASS